MKRYKIWANQVNIIRKSAKSIEMSLPVRSINRRVLNWVSTMQHFPVTGVDAYMGYSISAIISTSEKDQITGLSIKAINRSASII